MKEATGELNMTVITVVAIAAVAAIFYAFIWPSINRNMILGTACTQSGGLNYESNENGYDVKCGNGSCEVSQNGKSLGSKVCGNVNG